MSENKTLNQEQLSKVVGGEEETQYMCKKCNTIIDIKTAAKREIQTEGNNSASYQYGYWCPCCEDYVAVIPTDGLAIKIKIDNIKLNF